jgi:hypothetical protein
VRDEEKCPECGHVWGAHQGRKFSNKCFYSSYAGYQCPCQQVNPEVEAEDQLAGALWRGFMGGSR